MSMPLEEFPKQFGEHFAPRLLEILRAIKDTKPTMESDGKRATYEFRKEIDGKKSITFVKVEKYWYIQNH
jgi:hypothetical protein